MDRFKLSGLQLGRAKLQSAQLEATSSWHKNLQDNWWTALSWADGSLAEPSCSPLNLKQPHLDTKTSKTTDGNWWIMMPFSSCNQYSLTNSVVTLNHWGVPNSINFFPAFTGGRRQFIELYSGLSAVFTRLDFKKRNSVVWKLQWPETQQLTTSV